MNKESNTHDIKIIIDGEEQEIKPNLLLGATYIEDSPKIPTLVLASGIRKSAEGHAWIISTLMHLFAKGFEGLILDSTDFDAELKANLSEEMKKQLVGYFDSCIKSQKDLN